MQTDFVSPIDLDLNLFQLNIGPTIDVYVYDYIIIYGNSKVSKIDQANDRNFPYA